MKYKAYLKYKASGVEGGGHIPDTWNAVRLKRVAELRYGDSLASEERVDGGVPVFGSNGQVGSHTVANTLAPTIVVGRKGSFGKVTYSSSSVFAIDTTYFIDATCTNADLRWLYYCLQTLKLDVFSQDTGVPGLSREDAYARHLAFPSYPEQTAIASFLDRETAKIDTLIAKQEKLIELLKEKRQAVISHAVTKGLDPTVPMRPSGVEWLGEVPEHWEVCQIKRVLSSSEYGISESLNAEGAVPILRMGNLVDGHVSMDDLKFTDSLDDEMTLEPNDILFNRTNSLALVGKVGMYTGSQFKKVGFASYLVRLRANHLALPAYLTLLFNSDFVLQRARSDSIPAIGQANLNPTRYGTIKIPIPPIDEQERIVPALEAFTQNIDILISKAEKAIELQREHRSALISAAVTGKIDVRDAVSALQEAA